MNWAFICRSDGCWPHRYCCWPPGFSRRRSHRQRGLPRWSHRWISYRNTRRCCRWETTTDRSSQTRTTIRLGWV